MPFIIAFGDECWLNGQGHKLSILLVLFASLWRWMGNSTWPSYSHISFPLIRKINLSQKTLSKCLSDMQCLFLIRLIAIIGYADCMCRQSCAHCDHSPLDFTKVQGQVSETNLFSWPSNMLVGHVLNTKNAVKPYNNEYRWWN